MRNYSASLLAFFASALLVSCATGIHKEIAKTEIRKNPVMMEEDCPNKYDHMDEAIKHEFEITKDPALGTVPTERLLDAYHYMEEKNASSDRTAIAGIEWYERGPSNIGGRTRAILYDKNDATYKTIWAGGVGGGLWKTTDITANPPTWISVNDLFANMAITCIAQDPINTQIIYFGTGEGWYNIDAIRGNGIWKSTDGGVNWTQLSSTTGSNFYYINKIVIDATGKVYATTRGGGLQKSTDAGATWTKVLGNGVSGGTTDEVGDVKIAANGDIYCSTGNVFVTSGLYKSLNATYGINTGNVGNWSSVSLPTGITYRRIEICLAPTDTNRVYLTFGNNGTNSGGFMTSANKGVTWSTPIYPTICDAGTTREFTRGQWWYDLSMATDPANANTIYIGGINYLRSTDNGTSWTQISDWAPGYCATIYPYMHSDHHAMVFKPGSSSECVFALDGGVYYSSNIDAASPTISIKVNSYNVTQLYGADLSPTSESNNFIAGAQDNNSFVYNNPGINPVTLVSGGDGVLCHIDQDNSNQQISSYVYNNYYITTDNWATSVSKTSTGGSFINPTDLDDVNNYLYVYNTLGTYKRMTVPGGVFTSVTYGSTYGAATHIRVSPNVSNTIYIGTALGKVLRVANAHTATPTITNITGASFPAGSISCIEVSKDPTSPFTDDTILVTYSNYGVNSVWYTTNGAAASPTWNSVEGNLPDMPVRWALFPPDSRDHAMLATELGVWSTDNLNNASTDWASTNTGLANVSTHMLKMRSSDNLIIAATHGRGLYSSPGFVPFNHISFSTSSSTKNETDATLGTGCQKYMDLNIPVSITKRGAANIVVNITANVSSTATNGVDYTIMTPSLTFLSGSFTVVQNAVIRIYNDDEVEGTETIVLNIASPSTEITGTNIGTHTITINSDDVLPSFSVYKYTMGTGTVNTNTSTPFYGYYEDSRYQLLILASDLTAAGLTAGNLNAITFNLVKNSTVPYQGFTVSLRDTASTITNLSAFNTGTFTTVYSGTYTTVNGLNTITFTTPYYWNGTKNLILQTCFDNPAGGWTANDLCYGTLTGTRDRFKFQDGTTGCTLVTTPVQNGFVPNIIFTRIAPAQVQTAVNAGTADEQYLGPLQTIYFYDTNGKVMGSIQNTSTHDFGCTKLEVTRAGTSASDFWYTTPSTRVADKTFKVTPAFPDTTASYNITLYYTQGEINGWLAATGLTLADFKLLKIKNHEFNEVTPANPLTSSVTISTATTNAPYVSDYTFTSAFTGFSSFGGGNPGPPPPPLPVELISFDAKYLGDRISLSWKTLTEINNSGFEVERSLDGKNFEFIGFVKGAGNTTVAQVYLHNDFEFLADIQYYRLKQLDYNGQTKNTKIESVNIPPNYSQISVQPNPFSNMINLSLGKISYKNILIQLIDEKANVVQNLLNTTEQKSEFGFPVDATIPSGVYYVRINMDGQLINRKIIKQ